ncbi:Anaphase-promoting complex subunit 4 [Gracilaria domingensis]|nr:Anaphase-promoting complex subunit 4 [Gracilaria domingensis]
MESDNPRYTPTLLHERSFSAVVSDIRICPNKPLFAVVLDRVSVAIFKTNCQRLASISVCAKQQETITSFTWSPDGANVAVGTSSATLSVYSVDRCASSTSRTKQSSRDTDIVASVTLPAVASALLWTNVPAVSTKNQHPSAYTPVYQDRTSTLYENTPQSNPVSSAGLLLIGDSEGAVTLYTHNLQLRIARVQLLPSDVLVQRVFISPEQPHVLALGYRLCNTSTSGASANECILRVMSLASVVEYWSEIERINVEVVSTNLILKHISDTISRLQKEWIEGAMNVLTATIKKPIERRMKDFAEDASKRNAWGALHDIYCGAFMRNALLQFLGTDLSESGAKEALRSFRAHADDVEDAIVSALPFAEQMMFRASEYRGLARMEWRFAPVGVLLDEANEMLQASEAVYSALQELMHESQKMSREAEAFLAWLVIAAAKAGGVSGERRDPASLDRMSTSDKQLVADFLERMTGDVGNKPPSGDSVADLVNNELAKAYGRFERVVQSVFETPCKEITSQLGVGGDLSLGIPQSDHKTEPPVSMGEAVLCSCEKDHIILCLTLYDGALVFIRYGFASNRWNVCKTDVTLNDAKIFIKGVGCMEKDEILVLGVTSDEVVESKQLWTCLAFRLVVSFSKLFNACDQELLDGRDAILNSASTSTTLGAQESSSLNLGQVQMDDRLTLSTVNGNRFAR